MEAGEKELRKVFEEVTTRNVKASVSHSNETRKLVRELEQKVVLLEGVIMQLNENLNALKNQVANMQGIVYKGGTQ